jgi:hypothetical protein
MRYRCGWGAVCLVIVACHAHENGTQTSRANVVAERSKENPKELTRGKARDVLNRGKFPSPVDVSFLTGQAILSQGPADVITVANEFDHYRHDSNARSIAEKGLLQVVCSESGVYMDCTLVPSAKAKPYIQGEPERHGVGSELRTASYTARACELDLRDVTGIRFSEDKSKASVEVAVYPRKLTPFAFLAPACESADRSITCEFELWDDGWRLKADKPCHE